VDFLNDRCAGLKHELDALRDQAAQRPDKSAEERLLGLQRDVEDLAHRLEHTEAQRRAAAHAAEAARAQLAEIACSLPMQLQPHSPQPDAGVAVEAAQLRSRVAELEAGKADAWRRLGESDGEVGRLRQAVADGEADRRALHAEGERLGRLLTAERSAFATLRAQAEQLLARTAAAEARAEAADEVASGLCAAGEEVETRGKLHAEAAPELLDQLYALSAAREADNAAMAEAVHRVAAVEEEAAVAQRRGSDAAARCCRAESALAEARARLHQVEEEAAAFAADGREAWAAVAAERRRVGKAMTALAAVNADAAGRVEALHSRDAEAEQLKALAHRLDAGRAEMAAQLKAALGKIADAEAGRRAAEAAVAEAAARGDEQAARIAQLRQAISMLDTERDALVSEVDHKSEEEQVLRVSLSHAVQAAGSRDAREAVLVQEVGHNATLRAQAEDERDALRSRIDALAESEGHLRHELAERESELAATAHDLRKMIHENQVINAEINQLSEEAARLRDQLGEAHADIERLQQAAKAGESEMAELLRSYRRLSSEAHAAQASCTQLGSECHRLRQYAHSLERALEDTHAQMEGVTTVHAKLAFDAQAILDENAVFAEQVTAQT